MKKLLSLFVAVLIYSMTFSQTTASTTLVGSGSDPDGSIVAYSWRQSSNTGAVFSNSKAATTQVSGLALGVHIFELTVTDDRGATAVAYVKVTVILADNLPPVANAGTDQVIKLPSKAQQ